MRKEGFEVRFEGASLAVLEHVLGDFFSYHEFFYKVCSSGCLSFVVVCRPSF